MAAQASRVTGTVTEYFDTKEVESVKSKSSFFGGGSSSKKGDSKKTTPAHRSKNDPDEGVKTTSSRIVSQQSFDNEASNNNNNNNVDLIDMENNNDLPLASGFEKVDDKVIIEAMRKDEMKSEEQLNMDPMMMSDMNKIETESSSKIQPTLMPSTSQNKKMV